MWRLSASDGSEAALEGDELALGAALEGDEEEAGVDLAGAGFDGFGVGVAAPEDALAVVVLWVGETDVGVGWDQ